MTEQKRIGVVTGVTSGTLTAVMDSEIKSLTRELNGKVYFIGQIGSYVLVPVGKIIVVAMVSEFKKVDYSENGKLTQRCHLFDMDHVLLSPLEFACLLGNSVLQRVGPVHDLVSRPLEFLRHMIK